jgi:hypothetical protein
MQCGGLQNSHGGGTICLSLAIGRIRAVYHASLHTCLLIRSGSVGTYARECLILLGHYLVGLRRPASRRGCHVKASSVDLPCRRFLLNQRTGRLVYISAALACYEQSMFILIGHTSALGAQIHIIEQVHYDRRSQSFGHRLRSFHGLP